MLTVGLFSWWYLVGWGDFAKKVANKLRDLADFFSIGLILRTLFAPFRQISANAAGDSIDDRLHAWLDKLFSRVIGFIVRLGILLAGLVIILAQSLLGLALVVLWPLLPFTPLVCLILAVSGVTL